MPRCVDVQRQKKDTRGHENCPTKMNLFCVKVSLEGQKRAGDLHRIASTVSAE